MIKPVPTTNIIDVVGCKLLEKKINLYFSSDDTIFVNWHNGGVTEFDQHGFINENKEHDQIASDTFEDIAQEASVDMNTVEFLRDTATLYIESDWSEKGEKHFAFMEKKDKKESSKMT